LEVTLSGVKVKIISVSNYSEPLKSLVLKKMNGDLLASKQLGFLIYEKTPVRDFSFDIIVPIPLHWTRYAKRGFNQSYEMAKVVGKKLNVPVINVLKRIRKTKFQSSLSHSERQENLKDAFVLKNRYKDKQFFKSKKILIIDDLYTTGATVRNAIKPIVQERASSFVVAVACLT
jgi:competence protein ComFC